MESRPHKADVVAGSVLVGMGMSAHATLGLRLLRVLRLCVVLVLLAGFDHAAHVDAAPSPHESSLADLAEQVASSDSFYLLLDATCPQLTLELSGAILHTYDPVSVETGRRRVAWRQRTSTRHFDAAHWQHGRLTPPRPEERLVVEPGSADSLLVEQLRSPGPEATPTPELFWVTFEGDRELLIQVADAEVDSRGLKRLLQRCRAHIHAMHQALRGNGDRWRVTLSREQAGHLYRSLPPDACILIYRGASRPPS